MEWKQTVKIWIMETILTINCWHT